MSPADLADLADLRRQNPKTAKQQQQQQPQTTCLSLRDNAACCIPLRDQRYLRENKQARVLNRNPNVSRRSRRFTQIKPQNNKTALILNNLSFSAK